MADETMLWGEWDDEVLTCRDAESAIESYLDMAFPEEFESIGDVTVFEYRPVTIQTSDCGSPLEGVLEYLDEQYGDPDGTPAYAGTQEMRDAEKAFLETVIKHYKPWACEQTGKSVTVNALEWVREHRPDWLKDSAVKDQASD